ncbi:MAG: TldD/PmbA family protein, partial [Chitinophagales bacterium]
MAILSRDEARTILEKVVAMSKADDCVANLGGGNDGNIRYARNTVSTAGVTENLSLGVTSSYGKKTGTATINELDDASLEKVVRRSEELAKLSPENPEYMSPLGPQKYDEAKNYFESTAKITPEDRTKAAENSIVPSRKKDLVAAGFMEDYNGFGSMMNSKGLYAYDRSTGVDFTITVRTKDGTGSGYALRDYNDINKLDTAAATQIAMDKAAQSVDAKALEPGKYTVILEPAASSGLIGNMMYSFAARSADEGRSFLAKKGGGTKIGEQIVDDRITVYSDPLNAEVPTGTWSRSGLPRKKMAWIEDGVVKNLYYSRYWAKEKGKKATPFPSNIIIKGGDASLEDLIKSTKKGILVTRTWYIRTVDPQTLLYTGLTRDG